MYQSNPSFNSYFISRFSPLCRIHFHCFLSSSPSSSSSFHFLHCYPRLSPPSGFSLILLPSLNAILISVCLFLHISGTFLLEGKVGASPLGCLPSPCLCEGRPPSPLPVPPPPSSKAMPSLYIVYFFSSPRDPFFLSKLLEVCMAQKIAKLLHCRPSVRRPTVFSPGRTYTYKWFASTAGRRRGR